MRAKYNTSRRLNLALESLVHILWPRPSELGFSEPSSSVILHSDSQSFGFLRDLKDNLVHPCVF